MSPRVLYIVYWGAMEFLGRSLVVPSVVHLARRGARIALLTFEKEHDLADEGRFGSLRRDLTDAGVEWLPLRYHKWPKWPATGFDLGHGLLRGLMHSCRWHVDLIHARTFTAGPLGLALAQVLHRPLVYHNEGFYPDEQVDGGVWREGSPAHRFARALEARLYSSAAGIVTLSHRAREVVESLPAVQRQATPVTVVPSTVDIARFVRVRTTPRSGADRVRLIYIGSVGARYILDAVGRFAAVCNAELGGVELKILSHSRPDLIRHMLQASGLPEDRWRSGCLPHEAIPGELVEHEVGLFFLSRGLSEHACSPTKIGEYWAAGLPVVSTPNVSDSDAIIRQERVGVIVSDHTLEAYIRASRELWALLGDPELPRRCRAAAERHYALEPACERQWDLYARILARHGPRS